MKFLIAFALLVCYVAAHHIPEHNLRGPLFIEGQTHRYEGTINMTSGIPGLSTQVAKSVLKMEINIHAVTKTEYIMKVKNLMVSKRAYAVETDDEPLELTRDNELERELSKPVKFVLIEGQVESFTMDPNESLQSKKIKKSILRSLELTIEENVLDQVQSRDFEQFLPVMYNVTRNTTLGEVRSYYTINVSPYPDYPYEESVYNISRTEDFEPNPYMTLHKHSNFAKQGCPEVCNQENDDPTNTYGAGCPMGYEPHHTPVKMSIVQHCHMKLHGNRMIPEIMEVEEKHIANMYDQDMVVTIRSEFRLKEVNNRRIEEPKEQTTYEELHDIRTEISEQEIEAIGERVPYLSDEKCGLKRIEEAIPASQRLMEELVEVVIRGDLEARKSELVGEKIILLQKALTLLSKPQLLEVAKNIILPQFLNRASEEDKVKRQIWLDILPLVGTTEVVEFIKTLIERNDVTTWEAKEILEALPENIMYPSRKNIENLRDLLELPQVTKYHMLHSAAHITLAKVIQKLCVSQNFSETWTTLRQPQQQQQQQLQQQMPLVSRLRWSSSYHDAVEQLQQAQQETRWMKKCPRTLVHQIVKDVTKKLRNTEKTQEKVVYIETLAHMGTYEVLPLLVPYVYGLAEDLQSYDEADIDFLKVVTLYSLHNIVGYYPNETLMIVAPVYFNKTEVPRVRTAAFSVLLRSQPSLHVLQHVAQDSWHEPSQEVGSYVYSALESFGNASLPCLQLTAHRIKKVIGQTKRFDIGMHHAKNILVDYFDEIRNFGIEKRFAYTPSNESFIPHSLYSSIMYNVDSFKDVLMRFALNIQGVTEEELLKLINLETLGIRLPKDIPESKFNNMINLEDFVNRVPKEMRVFMFRRIFYTTSHYYFDAETIKQDLEPLIEHLRLMMFNNNKIEGHLVKLYIPSTYRTFTLARTLSFPVEFEMVHPTLLSLKIENQRTERGHWRYLVRPSMYHTTRYTNQIKNLGECKTYGVLHEQKLTVSFPFEVSLKIEKIGNYEISYKMPQLPKRVIRYNTETVTYAGEEKLERLPSDELREPIMNIPIMFKKEKQINIVGIPQVHLELHSEDINEGIFDMPRNWDEALHLAVTKLRNVGWRRKSFNVTLMQSSRFWPEQNEVTLRLYYNRTDVFPRDALSHQHQREDPHFETSPEKATWPWDHKDEDKVAKEVKTIYERFAKELAHVAHEFDIELDSKPAIHKAYLRIEYNHTYPRTLHSWVMKAFAQTPEMSRPIEAIVAHVMKFENRPNEFEYNLSKYGKQKAYFYNIIQFASKKLFVDPEITMQGELTHIPFEEIFRNELLHHLRPEYFYPETHEQCLRDVREGKVQSVACLRAIKEEAIFNKFNVHVKWMKDLPAIVRNVTYKVDQALRTLYYKHVDINQVDVKNEENTMKVTMEYINKLTDNPVLNAYIMTPEQNIFYKKVDPQWILPLSSIENVVDTYIHRTSNNTLMPTCVLMENYVRTYDHKTYPLPKDECTYILSTHCIEKKKFVVLAKQLSSSAGTKEIHMLIGKNEIVLTPASGNKYTVKFDNQEYIVMPEHARMLEREEKIHAYIQVVGESMTPNILVLHAHRAGVKIHYDGKNVKVQIHPRYKGEVCGLCSEYDGEVTRELVGVDQCLYSSSQDFARSTIIDAHTCGADTKPREPKFCPYGSYSYHSQTASPDYRMRTVTPRYPSYDEQENAPEWRNILQPRNDFICFSTNPVPVCKDDERPTETETMEVDFHCLPKHDITARKLTVESKRRVLQELSNKSVDFTETLQVAKSC